MAARVEAEREETKPQPAANAEVGQQHAAPDGVHEVSLTALRVQFPGLVSMAQE